MRYLSTLLVIALLGASLAQAGVIPAKSEMALSGSYVHPKDSDTVWSFDGQVAMPIGAKGYAILGPKFRLGSDDATQAAGAVLEFNLLGSAKSGPYFGANGLYNLKDVAGVERYTVDAVAGLKVELSPGGSGFKVFASKTVAGRGKDESDLTANAGIFVRF